MKTGFICQDSNPKTIAICFEMKLYVAPGSTKIRMGVPRNSLTSLSVFKDGERFDANPQNSRALHSPFLIGPPFKFPLYVEFQHPRLSSSSANKITLSCPLVHLR